MAFWKKSDTAGTGSESSGAAPFALRPSPGGASASKGGVHSLADSSPPNGASAGPKSSKPKDNGPAPELSADKLREMAGAAKTITAAFGEMVTLLMRVPHYKNHSLSDLEWLVVPALLTGQFALATAQSKSKGLTAPVGLVLWARVSEDVDKRLNSAPGEPIKLAPQEWRSGDIIWVISAVGDGRVVQGMLKRLQEKEWANKPAKLVARAKDGKPAVTTLGPKAA